ncbi:uncharacterized protein METZ01_LOCUS240943, partial [marine metagenome]
MRTDPYAFYTHHIDSVFQSGEKRIQFSG